MCTLLELAERFQSAIVGIAVGIVGFVGVIYTLKANSKLAARERAEILKHERTALRKALVAELKISKQALEDGLEKCNDMTGHAGVIVPTDPMSDVYRAVLPRIGVLWANEVNDVTMVYGTLAQFRKNLALLPGAQVFDQHRVNVPGQSVQHLITMQKNALVDVDRAIATLSKPLKPNSSEDD